jgi:hypothetical protein
LRAGFLLPAKTGPSYNRPMPTVSRKTMFICIVFAGAAGAALGAMADKETQARPYANVENTQGVTLNRFAGMHITMKQWCREHSVAYRAAGDTPRIPAQEINACAQAMETAGQYTSKRLVVPSQP